MGRIAIALRGLLTDALQATSAGASSQRQARSLFWGSVADIYGTSQARLSPT